MGRTAIHPGEHLAEQLEALEMSAAELGRRLRVPTNRVTAILHGHRAVTGDTALRLGHFFGNSPQFWLNLQSLYDLRVAERKLGKGLRSLATLRERRPAARRPEEERPRKIADLLAMPGDESGRLDTPRRRDVARPADL